MDLQAVFYIFGIIYMGINILLLLGIVIGILVIVNQVKEAKKKVEEKVNVVKDAVNHPEDLLANIGSSVIRRSVLRFKKRFEKEKKKSEDLDSEED